MSNGEPCTPRQHPGDISEKEADAGILPSHGITLSLPIQDTQRPGIVQHLSSPAFQSPLRHHRRTPSQHREVKETLNARSEYTNSEDDGKAEHRINQYIIGEEIGRGSFGAVHLAKDQYGNEYAIKEFSKARLRKRARSNILRRPQEVRRAGHLGANHLAANRGFNSPLHRHSASDLHDSEENRNPLYLIKEEIAIMKKLNHPNLVSLIEVLDDPDEDSLYMVLEMCKKGVVMKVGLDEQADPYDSESCRCWFRDLILGIEYLHAQGVVHRDIKPDNLLLTEDDVLKIVDFGVSEMFEKSSDMMTAKSAGSPAFLPPELCIAKHGDISGKAADIWSMGVSLFCLRFGRIPFEKTGVMELYEAIKNDKLDCAADNEPLFVDLMHRLLEKDPKKRITMLELREHPWVTNNGTDPLLPYEENISDLVEPPSEKEMNHAITTNMKNLVVVMKAVRKFKSLIWSGRPKMMQGRLGDNVRTVDLHLAGDDKQDHAPPRTKSLDLDDRRAVESALVAEGVHRPITPIMKNTMPLADRIDAPIKLDIASFTDEQTDQGHHQGHKLHLHSHVPPVHSPSPPHTKYSGDLPGERGHAHDPMNEEPLFLGIGTGGHDDDSSAISIAESPTAAEYSIYDTAYQKEVERIREAQGHMAKVYLTRRVDGKKEYRSDANMVDLPKFEETSGHPHKGFLNLVEKAKEQGKAKEENITQEASSEMKEKEEKNEAPKESERLESSTEPEKVAEEKTKKSESASEHISETKVETPVTSNPPASKKVPSPMEIKSRGKKLSDLVDRAQEGLKKKGKEGSGMVSGMMQKVSALGRRSTGSGSEG